MSPRIRVDPSVLRQSSKNISGVGTNLSQVGQSALGKASGAPSYDGQFGPRVQAIGYEALSRAQGLSGKMSTYSGQLQSRAQAFEAADMGMSKGSVLGIATSNLTTTPHLFCAIKYTKVTKSSAGIYSRLGQLVPRKKIAKTADQIKSVLLMGRTHYRELFKTAAPRIIADLRRNPLRKIKGGTPLGFLLDAGLGYLAGDDHSLRGGGIAITEAAINIGVWKITVVNAIVQLGGSSLIWSISQPAKLVTMRPEDRQLVDESAERAQRALEKADIGKVTRAVATAYVDVKIAQAQAVHNAFKDAMQTPSVKNILRTGLLGLSLVTPGTENVAAMLDPNVSKALTSSSESVLKAGGDFVVGIIDAPFELGRHIGTSVVVTGTGIWDRIQKAAESFQAGFSPTY